jgi:hypothetical protein
MRMDVRDDELTIAKKKRIGRATIRIPVGNGSPEAVWFISA